MSRSIIIRMKRRAPHEHVDQFRLRTEEPVGHALRERLAQLSEIVGPCVGADFPVLLDGVVDRPAEIWEPLIAIADAAGGHWPQTARVACVELCNVAADRKVSLGIRLLADLRVVFGTSDALHTETILHRLTHGDYFGLDADAPWSDLGGKPIGDRRLASMLKKYDVTPLKVKIDGRALQGYRREHLWDAWSRYLSPVVAQVEPPEPAVPPNAIAGLAMVPKVPQVPDIPTRESANGICKACDGEGCEWCER